MSFYDNIHRIDCNCGGTENIKSLRISIDIDKSNNSGKVYFIQITDDDDPCFLYNVILREEDFNELKTEQRLRVSFDNFPDHLVEILNGCRDLPEQFTLILEDVIGNRSVSSLKIMEISKFKEMCVLNLRIKRGLEDDIRQLLCTKIAKLNTMHQQLGRKSQELEHSLLDWKQRCKEKTEKISELERRLMEETNTIREELTRQICIEKDKRENDLKDKDLEHRNQIEELQNSITLLNHKNEVYKDQKTDTDKENSSLVTRLTEAESSLQKLSESNERLRSRNVTLEKEVAGLGGQVMSLNQKVSVLETEVRRKTTQCSQLQNQLRATDETVARLKYRVQQDERTQQQYSEQLKATQEQLTQLQKEKDRIAEKRKLTVQVVAQLENKIANLEHELAEQCETSKENEKQLQISTGKLGEAQAKMNEMQLLIDKKDNEIRKQVDVNALLHRKLSENGNLTCPEPTTNNLSTNVSSSFVANRTLPPWIQGKISAVNSTLDPVYLKPHEDSGKNKKNVSAYFPK